GTPQGQNDGNRSDGPYQPYQPYEPYQRPPEDIDTTPVLPAMSAMPSMQTAPATPAGPKPLLLAQDVVKQFKVGGGGTVTALRHVTLTVGEGRIVAIRGRSGAGKTTLLNIIAGLDSPTSGHIALFGRDLAALSERKRTEMRRHDLGFVFQAAHLNPVLTARENVEVPLRLARTARKEREGRSHEALSLVVLADEPTGNLDSHTGLAILDLMRRVAHRAGITFIVTTHDPQASQMADEVYDISDGVLSPGQR